MINKIITGIAQGIDKEFNKQEKYTIYTESIEQGFDEPCFSIFSLTPINTQLVGNRYKREYSFDIQYFSENKEINNNEINGVVERLFSSLEYITVDNSLLRGTNMNAEVVDKVLHFFINFNMIVKKQIEKAETMNNLDTIVKLGGR